MGRPTDYTPELAEQICEYRSNGMSLRKIEKQPDMPSRESIRQWFIRHDGFLGQYVQACNDDADDVFEELIELADSAKPEDVQVIKLRIDTRKWVLSKRLPKKYGDKVIDDQIVEAIKVILECKPPTTT